MNCRSITTQKLFVYLLTLLSVTLLSSCSSGGGTTGTGGGSVLRGTIVNPNQQPLANVSATVLDDNQKAVSDDTGGFALNVDSNGGDIRLQFDGAGLNGATILLTIPESNGTVFVIFEGDAEANKVTESNLRVEDHSNSNDSTNDDHGNSNGHSSGSGSNDDGSSDGVDDNGGSGYDNSGEDNSGGYDHGVSDGSDSSGGSGNDNGGDDNDSSNDDNSGSSSGGGHKNK